MIGGIQGGIGVFGANEVVVQIYFHKKTLDILPYLTHNFS